jgi:ribonuclease HI
MDKKPMMLYADGGANPNPGKMAIAAVLYDGKDEIARVVKVLGNGTNNVAEYNAIIEGLTMARAYTDVVVCYSDSKLAIKQLCDQWRIKQPHLYHLVTDVIEIARRFESVEFKLTSRAHPRIRHADMLLKEARQGKPLQGDRETT